MIKIILSRPIYCWKIMKWTTIVYTMMVFCLLTAKANEIHGQVNFESKLVLKEETISLRASLRKISKQTGVDFAYSSGTIPLGKSIHWTKGQTNLKQVMDYLGEELGLKYSVVGNSLLLLPRQNDEQTVPSVKQVDIKQYKDSETQDRTIEGRVLDADTRQPMAGATVSIVGTSVSTTTNNDGRFTLQSPTNKGTLRIAYIGYNTQEVNFGSDTQSLNIQLARTDNKVDEVQVIGYGQTTRRYNTGSVSTVSSAEIEQQPVTNVLSALSGRMPGVFVQTTNGLPGGNINIQIRGTGSIEAGTQPLYIIDGVPFDSSFGSLSPTNVLASETMNGMVSPLNSINPNDIESISVLKDADATAIYGSRGSNGVVLITTKKALTSDTKVNIDFSTAINEAANLPKLLTAEQYFSLREEAFANDGITPSSDQSDWSSYAPELTVWDRNNITDWAKFFLDGTGNINNIQSSVLGGNERTNYSLSGNYREETTYLPGENIYKRASLSASLRHTSNDGKFTLQFSNALTIDDNKLVNPSQEITLGILLPPNYPIFNDDGSFNWYSSNPVAALQKYSKAKSENLITNLRLGYSLTKDINVNISTGYNRMALLQRQVFPETALYPGSTNYTNFGDNGNNTFIFEPQINYLKSFGQSDISVLIGGTYQNSQRSGETIRASSFLHSSLMENLASASYYELSNTNSQYKYASAFSRLTLNHQSKYILNLSVRRDVSSKFGPDNKVGHFGAVGVAWQFGQEGFIKSSLPFLSFGKLRGSFGITGNDQISDYQYLSSYGNSGVTYDQIPTLTPLRIANGNFRWESTRKAELAIEIGLFEDRVFFNAIRYANTSTDQLVEYAIPSLSGFTSYQANLPAKVDNKGWELELLTHIIKGRDFNWTTNFNLTISRNVLREFDNLSTSSYANTLVIGEDINRIYGYKFSRLDEDGRPLYITKDGEETQYPSSVTDAFFTIGRQTPDFYGGIGQSFSYKNWSLDIFGQFVKQWSRGGLNYFTTGSYRNSYSVMLDRWTPTNTETNIPRASTNSDYSYWESSANFFDASYFRLKNISLNYTFRNGSNSASQLNGLRIYFQAQNPYTFWNKDSALLDPESGSLSTNALQRNLPPTRTFQLGLAHTF